MEHFFENLRYSGEKVSRSRAATGLLYMGTAPLMSRFYHMSADTAQFYLEACLVSPIVAPWYVPVVSQYNTCTSKILCILKCLAKTI